MADADTIIKDLPPSQYEGQPLCPRCGVDSEGRTFVRHGDVASDGKTYRCNDSCVRYHHSDELCSDCERIFLHDVSKNGAHGPVPGAEYDPHWLMPCWRARYGSEPGFGIGDPQHDHDPVTGVSRITCGRCSVYVETKDGEVVDRTLTFDEQMMEGQP